MCRCRGGISAFDHDLGLSRAGRHLVSEAMASAPTILGLAVAGTAGGLVFLAGNAICHSKETAAFATRLLTRLGIR